MDLRERRLIKECKELEKQIMVLESVSIDGDSWTFNDDGKEYYGDWNESSDERRGIEIEWESDAPENWEEIEDMVISAIDDESITEEVEEPNLITKLSKKILGARRCHGGCH